MIATMVKRLNAEKADKTELEEIKQEFADNSTPLDKFRFFKDKL